MYTRCKACNTKFVPRFNKATQQEEDLCSNCLTVVNLALLDADLEVKDDSEIISNLLDLDLKLEENNY